MTLAELYEALRGAERRGESLSDFLNWLEVKFPSLRETDSDIRGEK